MRAFVIAMRCEADAVEPHLKQGDRLYVAGIGKVNAAAATQKAICEGATEIWNAGLAGGIGAGIAVGDIVAISSAVEYDFDLADLNGTCVGQLNERDSPYIPMATGRAVSLNGRELGSRILGSGDRFNDSEADIELLKGLGVTVRDMEGAAIAHVCEKEGVPCRSFKCISDVHGGDAMTRQYQDNLKTCLAKLSAAMKELLG